MNFHKYRQFGNDEERWRAAWRLYFLLPSEETPCVSDFRVSGRKRPVLVRGFCGFRDAEIDTTRAKGRNPYDASPVHVHREALDPWRLGFFGNRQPVPLLVRIRWNSHSFPLPYFHFFPLGGWTARVSLKNCWEFLIIQLLIVQCELRMDVVLCYPEIEKSENTSPICLLFIFNFYTYYLSIEIYLW